MTQAEPEHPPVPRRNTRPWAIAAAVIVIGGVAAAAITGGGMGNGDSSAGAQMTRVTNAPPPKKGDRVVAAGAINVSGTHYRVVLSSARASDAKRASLPLYVNEYLGQPARLLQRLRMPWPWARDSSVVDFKVEATPGSNPDKTASLALSWFLHGGDQAQLTHYFQLTSHGVEID
jgi:hypothetical protein